MRRFSAAQVIAALFSIVFLSFLVACSGTSTTPNAVTQITLTPTSLSLNPGQVVQLAATPKDASGGSIIADVSFSSSNTSLVTVSAGGYVCGGIWDSNFINCVPNPGQSGVGQATITATSNGVTATAAAYTHLHADRIVVNPIPACVSVGATPTYTASVFNVTAAGCSTASPCDITSTVGPIIYTSTDLQVMANNVTTGILTAANPGGTSIFATVSGLNSVPQPALVCPIASILIHDASSSNTSFTLAPGGTQALAADVIDTNGVTISPVLTWASTPSGSAIVTGASGANTATITAGASGTAIITATCSTPDCNRNVSPQYGQNVVTAATTGASTTTVYAASTSSLMLVPIPNSTNVPGTAITLPFQPNSMVSNYAGNKLYLGSSSGFMTVDPVSASVTSTTAVGGKILGISPNGQFLVVVNPSGVTYFVNLTNSSVVLTQAALPNAAAFTPDSKSVSFLGGQQLYYNTTAPSSNITSLPYVPDAIDVSAQGSLMYITSAATHAIDVRSTCNQSDLQTLTANNPSLVAHLPNALGAVVADSPSIDVITTGTIAPGCPATATNTVATYNLGGGNFTARQLFLSSDSSRAWLISDLTSVIGFNLTTLAPTAIPLANGAQALSGGVTLDGSHVYVGASDKTVHVLDVASGTDTAQIAVALTDVGSNPVAPDLVVVLPK